MNLELMKAKPEEVKHRPSERRAVRRRKVKGALLVSWGAKRGRSPSFEIVSAGSAGWTGVCEANIPYTFADRERSEQAKVQNLENDSVVFEKKSRRPMPPADYAPGLSSR